MKTSRYHIPYKHRRYSRGFSLIEVLVALVVLSVGMLGVLTLQVKGLQFSQSARISTNAILAASDMADRIRANPNGGLSYVAGLGGAGDQPQPQCADLPNAPMPANTTCTTAELAAFDIWLWKEAIASDAGLPGGEGSIEVLLPAGAVATTTYTVTLNYTERGEPRAYQVVINN
ncbi:MAG: type IV pilus modification protein PilV [Pseudomonadota bacterium]